MKKRTATNLGIRKFSEIVYTGLEVVPSGSYRLDKALGTGGFPLGRIVQVYGQSSSGKSTLSLHVVANAQRMGLVAAIVEPERTFVPEYAAELGVDTDQLYFQQPTTTEEAFEGVQYLLEEVGAKVIVLDSLAALVPNAEVEGDFGDAHMGLSSRLNSQAFRKLTPIISDKNALFFIVNQVRANLSQYGSPISVPGGKAAEFHTSQGVYLSASKDKANPDRSIVKAQVRKNKLAPPHREAVFSILYGKGIDQVEEIIEEGVAQGHIDRGKVGWLTYGEVKAQGAAKLAETLGPEGLKGLREKLC